MAPKTSPDTDGHMLPVRKLDRAAPTSFLIEPDAEAREALASELGVSRLRKLRFEGRVEPEGKDDLRLVARLGATVIQPCVVTLEPVTTRIDTDVERRFVAELPEPEGEEVEMPEDDTLEPLPAVLDLAAIMAEALALALPQYPRAEGVELGEAVYAEPGVEPLRDDDLKPLASLAALRDKLAGNAGGEDDGKG